jgi:hypothetical protein
VINLKREAAGWSKTCQIHFEPPLKVSLTKLSSLCPETLAHHVDSVRTFYYFRRVALRGTRRPGSHAPLRKTRTPTERPCMCVWLQTLLNLDHSTRAWILGLWPVEGRTYPADRNVLDAAKLKFNWEWKIIQFETVERSVRVLGTLMGQAWGHNGLGGAPGTRNPPNR